MEKDDLEDLYRKYYDSLMIVACSYTHNKEDAMDLVQTTFLKAYLSYQPTGSFLYWCNRVLRNEFYHLLEKQKRIVDEEWNMELIKAQDDILGEYIKKEERTLLAAMISVLPLKYREVMMDSIYLELSDAQIAIQRNISTANVRQLRSRAKKLLLKMTEANHES